MKSIKEKQIWENSGLNDQFNLNWIECCTDQSLDS